MLKLSKVLFSLALFVFLGGAAISVKAQTTFTVTKTADTNDGTCNADCSLREAVDEANNLGSDDTINFAASLNNQTVVLTAGEIAIDTNIVITNSGSSTITISGNNNSRIFYITAGNVTINGLILRDGNGKGVTESDFGGAILVDGGALTLARSTLRDNQSDYSSGALELRQAGPHRIIESTIYNNEALDDLLGGGVCGGFAADAGANVYLINSTISTNQAENGEGGGLCSLNNSFVRIRNSTIANNAAANLGGGIANFDLGQIEMGNTIVADNSATNSPNVFNEIDPSPPQSSIFTSLGYNLISSTTPADGVTWQPPNDILNQAANLASLANYGGPTETHALNAGSPAIDAGNNSLAVDVPNATPLTVDQRGFSRVVDGDGSGTATVDIGATERLLPTSAGVTVGGRAYTPTRRGAAYINVHLTRTTTGQTTTVTTDARGYFNFTDVALNDVYIISVSNTDLRFVPQTLQVNNQIDDLQIRLGR